MSDDHIKIGKDDEETGIMGTNFVHCTKCRQKYNYQIPIKLKEFTALIKHFLKFHEGCGA